MKTTDNLQELFVVVDKNDNIVGYKTRAECHSNRALTHRGAGVVIFNNEGLVLLQKRSQTKDMYPGYFSISASGHVNKGESYEETAQREMYEEIGVKAKVTFVKKFFHEDTRETEIDALFTAKYDGPVHLNKDEVESVTFKTKEEIQYMKDQLTPYARKCLEIIEIL